MATNLSIAETAVVSAARRFQAVDLSEFDDATVRAEVIEHALLGNGTELPVSVRGVRIVGGLITGQLRLGGADIKQPLAFEKCVFEQAADLQDARLLSLVMSGCASPGLNAAGVLIHGSMRLDKGFTANDTVNLLGGRIGGSLYLRDSSFFVNQEREGTYAIEASRLHVGQHLSAVGIKVVGQTRLISARIGGVLNLRRADLVNPGQESLQAERMEVGESVWFGKEFRSQGRILLNKARIGGAVDLIGSTFTDPQVMTEPKRLVGVPLSLRASGVRIGRDLQCTDGFTATGGVEIDGAQVGGTVSFDDAARCGSGETLNLSGTTAETIELLFRTAPQGALDLRNARSVVLVDDPRSLPSEVLLDGFTYTRMRPPRAVTVRERLRWLRLNGDSYLPQPYEQLAAAYRANGQEQEARRVALAKQRARRRQLNVPGQLAGWFLEVTVGYGYRTWLAGIWIFVLMVSGAVAFDHARPIPTVDRPPTFHATMYALDLLLPIIDLGQERTWRFEDWRQWVAWCLVTAGWLLTTSVVAAISRILNRSS